MPIFANRWLRAALLPWSILYYFGMTLRNKLYDWHILSVKRLECKVISVGNITVGGTGKTPAVAYLAARLREQNRRVVIASRGYGRKNRGQVLVADGEQLLVEAQESGDEPFMLARKLKNIPVIVDNNRHEAGRKACTRFSTEFLLLDDGFQYRHLQRDLDIVLLDARCGIEKPWLLPAGPFRELPSSLARAQMVWLTRVEPGVDIEGLRTRVAAITKAPVVCVSHKANRWISTDGEALDRAAVFGKRILAFAGIADPGSFEKTLRDLGAEVVRFLSFRDHHWYNNKDRIQIDEVARVVNVTWVVTSEKDFVRLPKEFPLSRPLYYLEIEMEVNAGGESLDSALSEMTRKRSEDN